MQEAQAGKVATVAAGTATVGLRSWQPAPAEAAGTPEILAEA